MEDDGLGLPDGACPSSMPGDEGVYEPPRLVYHIDETRSRR